MRKTGPMPPIVYPPSEASLLPGFCGNRLDRMAERREDPDWIADQALRDDADVFLFIQGRIVTAPGDGGVPRVRHDRATAERLGVEAADFVFLGLADGAPCFGAATGLDEALIAEQGPYETIDFRALVNQGAIDTETIGALAEARSLVVWHDNHGFCAKCGAPTAAVIGGWRRDCGTCGANHFPRTDPVVIMFVTDGDNALLGRQTMFPPGMYSALAGFVEPGETIEAAVRREVWEEAGVAVGRVAYYASQPWPFPSTLMIGCFAEATTTAITIDPAELEDCRWFTRDEVVAMLAETHQDGIVAPRPLAIAHWLARAFVEADEVR